MTAAAILQMILWLAPHIGAERADWYTRSIIAAADIHEVADPMDVLSVIQKESEFDHLAVGPTRDFGLGQIHVSKTTHAEYLGREELLLDPQLNIYLAVKSLAYWHRYHWGNCRSAHLYVAHYKFGNHVRRGWRSVRFFSVYRKLVGWLRERRPRRV